MGSTGEHFVCSRRPLRGKSLGLFCTASILIGLSPRLFPSASSSALPSQSHSGFCTRNFPNLAPTKLSRLSFAVRPMCRPDHDALLKSFMNRDRWVSERRYKQLGFHYIHARRLLAILSPPLSSGVVPQVQLPDVGCPRRRYPGQLTS